MILNNLIIITTKERKINYPIFGLWNLENFQIVEMVLLAPTNWIKLEKELVNVM
jgi:hypothetical protein